MNTSNEIAAVLPVLLFTLGICLVAWGLQITNYILRGIAIWKMSANRGIAYGGLGFVPIVNRYQLGKLAGEIEFGKKKVKNTGVWLLVLPIALGAVAVIGMILIMVPYTFRMIALDQYPYVSPEMIASPLIGFTVGIVLFTLVMIFAQAILYLFRGLALHRVFSLYHGGQRPVFYTILAIFIPLAESILLFKSRNKPLLDTNL